MAGTLISYQGFRCARVVFRRTRGYSTDTSEVDIPLGSFSGAFGLRAPTLPPGLGLVASISAGDATQIMGDDDATLEQPSDLRAEGTLTLVEVVDGKTDRLDVPHMFVVRADTVELADEDGGFALLRVVLADLRYFWPRGVLTRWSFNRVRQDGTLALDSAKPDGKPFNLGEIAASVVADMFRSPDLAHHPAEWDVEVPTLGDFQPFAPASTALAKIVQETSIEEPCLRLDGSVALHATGDGAVATAKENDLENTEPLDQASLLFEEGTGQGYTLELGYPDEYVVVVGGPTVATQQIDEWDAVLLPPNQPPAPLNDETLKALTKGRVNPITNGPYDMAWLANWILAPADQQGATGLPDAVTSLLREQAWRFWRLPLVEAVGQDGVKPGRNAHLLPLQDRAETRNGKRLPTIVERSSFVERHFEFLTSVAHESLRAAELELSKIRGEIGNGTAPGFNAGNNPFVQSTSSLAQSQLDARRMLSLLFEQSTSFADASFASESRERLQQMIDRARTVAKMSDVNAAIGAQYEKALEEAFKAKQTLTGFPESALYQMAKQVIALEKTLAAAQQLPAFLKDPTKAVGDPKFSGYRNQIFQKLGEIRREAQRAEREREAKEAAGAPAITPPVRSLYRNMPRGIDAGARVVSAELGIVATSGLAGHLAKEDVVHPAAGRPFVPRPVRVTFGSVLRPRLDRPPGGGQSVASGSGREDRPADVVREAESDADTYFVAAFVRQGLGLARAMPLDEVPKNRASRLLRPDLVELIPLPAPVGLATSEGAVIDVAGSIPVGSDVSAAVFSTNRAILDAEAQRAASEVFRRVDTLNSTKHVLARPQRIQCDGIVAGIEIRSLPLEHGGFQTIVTTGSTVFARPRGREQGRPPTFAPLVLANRESAK